MTLAFDIGNSAIKGGVYSGPTLQHTFRSPHARRMLSATIEAETFESDIEWAGIASVVPDSTRAVIGLLDERGIPAVVVRHDMKLPFRVAYRTPETLGADRIAAAAAAWLRAGDHGSVVALDAGTAVTCEVVLQGIYLGGTISPGPALMQRALNRDTAQLPEVPLEFPDSVLGSSTKEAIQAGVMYGFLDGIKGLLKRIADTIGEAPYVLATGGWGSLLRDHVDEVREVDPHLVLDGVHRLAEMNR